MFIPHKQAVCTAIYGKFTELLKGNSLLRIAFVKRYNNLVHFYGSEFDATLFKTTWKYWWKEDNCSSKVLHDSRHRCIHHSQVFKSTNRLFSIWPNTVTRIVKSGKRSLKLFSRVSSCQQVQELIKLATATAATCGGKLAQVLNITGGWLLPAFIIFSSTTWKIYPGNWDNLSAGLW